MKFKLPFFNKKPLTKTDTLLEKQIETKPQLLTEAELLQQDKQKLDDFEKESYIENDMLVMYCNKIIRYHNKHAIQKWQVFIEENKPNQYEPNQYDVICDIDGADEYVFSCEFYNIENAKEYVKKLTALIQKLNNN